MRQPVTLRSADPSMAITLLLGGSIPKETETAPRTQNFALQLRLVAELPEEHPRTGTNGRGLLRRQLAKHTITLLIAIVFAAGCKGRQSRRVAMIPETTGTELWEAAHTGAEIAAERNGYSVYWNAPTREDDFEGQIRLIERAIQSHEAGLILAPSHYLALVSAVREAHAKKLPIVVIRSALPLPAESNLKYILNDEEDMGRLAARRIGLLLGNRGQVAILGFNPDANGILLRERSFESELGSRYPGITIVERRGGSSNIAELQQIAEEVLQDHPDIDAILTLTSPASEGAWAALSAVGRIGGVRLVGCDQEIDLMAGIRNGAIDSIVAENTYEMGKQAMEWIADYRSGKSQSGAVRLPPVLITKLNIDDPDIQKMLAVNWRLKH